MGNMGIKIYSAKSATTNYGYQLARSIKLNLELFSEGSKFAYKDRGVKELNAGNFAKAMKYFDEAVKLDPEFVGAINNQGVAYYQMGLENEETNKFEKAIEKFSIAIDKGYMDAYFNRGMAYMELEEYLSAVKDFTMTIKQDQGNLAAYFFRANAHKKLKNYLEAIKDYDMVLNGQISENLEGFIVKAFGDRGTCKCHLNDFAGVVNDYNKALELDPKIGEDEENAPLFINLGVSFENLGKYKEAIEAFEKAFKLDPQCLHTHLKNLIEAKKAIGDEKGAREAQEKYKNFLLKTVKVTIR